MRIRKYFDPLTVVATLEVLGEQSQTLQVYDVKNNSYVPDYTENPLVIFPRVFAQANDKSWKNGSANHLLANMKWLVNGSDIASLPAWTGKYEIVTSGNTRGSIRIKKNILPSEKFEFVFKATLPDTRTGVNIPVTSDVERLSTVDKSADEWGVSIDDNEVIQYDPFYDKLLLHEYKLANGIPSSAPASNVDTYKLSVGVDVSLAGEQMSSGYTLKLYKVDSLGNLSFAGSISNNSISFDLRVIERANYLIKVLVDDEEKARKQFSIERLYSSFSTAKQAVSNISNYEKFIRTKLVVNHNGKVHECPGLLLDIIWKTSTVAIPSKEHNQGEVAHINIASTGIGFTHTDSYIDISEEVSIKGVYKTLTDASGNKYIDNNNELINN